MDESVRYLSAMGARVAPKKCFFFANPYADEASLKTPGGDGEVFEIKHQFRDLVHGPEVWCHSNP